jgi:4-amino-4-deoxychorismate lyase
MCQFVETICIQDGKARNLRYHIDRMNRTIRQFFPHLTSVTEADLLPQILQESGLQKARVVYSAEGITERTFAPYALRTIQNIALVEDNEINYRWKSTDRTPLTRQREKAPHADEVIIIKDGCVTDTSYTNLCFFDGHEWFTPDTPLLPGTMRQYLLDQGLIKPRHILATDILHYQRVSLINAMMVLGDLCFDVASIQGI